MFNEGERVKDIFSLFKNQYKAQEKPINFTYEALKNYLYDKHREFVCRFSNITDIYKELQKDKEQTKNLLLLSLGEIPNLKALAFCFNEQVEYGKIFMNFMNSN